MKRKVTPNSANPFTYSFRRAINRGSRLPLPLGLMTLATLVTLGMPCVRSFKASSSEPEA